MRHIRRPGPLIRNHRPLAIGRWWRAGGVRPPGAVAGGHALAGHAFVRRPRAAWRRPPPASRARPAPRSARDPGPRKRDRARLPPVRSW